MDARRLLPGGALALVVLLVGCGADAGTDGADDAPPAADPRAAATSLEITVWPEGEGNGAELAYTLSCDPPAGDHPDPEGACAALRELGVAAFAPTPPDVMCTQQYGGPMQARVVGTVEGEPLDARLAYHDGCEIARWDTVAAVVPRPDGELS
jgi:hypothetical protein